MNKLLAIFTALILAFVACNNSEAQSKRSSKGNSQQKYSTKSKKAIAIYKDGELDYQFQRLQDALLKFEQATKIDPNFTEAYFMLSEVYRDMGDYEQQVAHIQTAVGLDSTYYVSAYYHAGVALCNLGRFAEATEWFELYKHYSAGKRNQKNVEQWLKRAMIAKYLMEHPVAFKPHIVADSIVMDYDQYWPSITLDEEELVFTTLMPRDPEAYATNKNMIKNIKNFNEDFYISKKIDGQWSKPTPLKGINTPNNEGAQTLSADGQWMFFTICGRNDSKGSCDIYFSRRTETGWTEPENIGAPVNTPYWESQPCFSADGQTLYFVSSRPGGKGDMDIWTATITGFMHNGLPIFGNVKNLGDSINTSGSETSPFIHPDGKTLYFSSDGWPGVGKLDIFVSRKNQNNEWGIPQNIGYPINTPLDDNGLVINATGNTAYLASTRQQKDGTYKKDLLCFELPQVAKPEPVSYIKGHVYDSKTHKPLKANLELIRLDTKEKQVNAQSEVSDGTFIVCLPSGRDYGLFASCPGYLFSSQNFALKDATTSADRVTLDIPLSPLTTGQKVTLNNVFFDTNSTELKQESVVELDRLVLLMKNNTDIKVEIGGHTDNVGSAEYNKKLSEGRAKTTVDYLTSKGIAPIRITYKGYGMTQPISTNATEEGRAQNRRIEAKIL